MTFHETHATQTHPIVWLITGASRGFGLEIVRRALGRGDRVVATARRPEQITDAVGEHENLLVTALDVTDQDSVDSAVAQAVERFGRIDVLVNNAGHGFVGALEEVSDAELRALYDVNVFGLAAVTRTVLPVMRRQRAGRVLNLSSVAGFSGAPGWGAYSSSKFAVEAFTESMRAELAPLGISVTVIEPGYFRTDFLDGSSLRIARHRIEDYDPTAGASRTLSENTNHLQPGDPRRAVAAILQIVDASEPPLRLQLGADCVARVEGKLDYVRGELETWRELSLSTNYADAIA